MKIGISLFTTDRSAGPAEVAREVERRGFESFWVSEHSHIPVASAPPFPGFDPRVYAAMLDPFVALTAAAGATHRIRLGTAVCLVTQHDPINCAKSVASLDRVSNGRFLFGIGAGWNFEEMTNHGTDPASRFRLMRERVEAMQTIWTQEQAAYHGRLVNFDAIQCWPKPVQQPHPPILIGGVGPNVLKRVIRYGSGWLPPVAPAVAPELRGRVIGLADLEQLISVLQTLASAADRAPPTVTVSGLAPEPAILATLRRLGVERMILRLAPTSITDVTAQLDAFRQALQSAGHDLENV